MLQENIRPVISAASGGLGQDFLSLFLGQAPSWYKNTILGFLLLNVLAWIAVGPLVTGWLLLAEFIFTLALALRCYPVQPGGLLALQAVLLGLATPEAVYEEVKIGLPVVLLIVFMMSGVHFLRELLFLIVSKMLLTAHSRVALGLTVCATIAVLSAFLDALTILAILIAATEGFYEVYHRTESEHPPHDEHDLAANAALQAQHREELEQFRRFLCAMLMHSAVGTTIGGICTLVGEPQNLVIGSRVGWDFTEFFWQVAPVSLPVLAVGLVTCALVEHFRVFGYGHDLPAGVRRILESHQAALSSQRSTRDKLVIVGQSVIAVGTVFALAFHVAEIGLIGLALLVLVSAFIGVVEERRIARAFEEGTPFAALLMVFFAIVAMIHQQHLFDPVVHWVLSLGERWHVLMIYVTNGLLSAISDNVFVATIYIEQVKGAFDQGLISRAALDAQSVAVVIGTGVPSMATPNGQAAFLFLLTSALAVQIRLSYLRMTWMALPYVVTTSVTAWFALSALVS